MLQALNFGGLSRCQMSELEWYSFEIYSGTRLPLSLVNVLRLCAYVRSSYKYLSTFEAIHLKTLTRRRCARFTEAKCPRRFRSSEAPRSTRNEHKDLCLAFPIVGPARVAPIEWWIDYAYITAMHHAYAKYILKSKNRTRHLAMCSWNRLVHCSRTGCGINHHPQLCMSEQLQKQMYKKYSRTAI